VRAQKQQFKVVLTGDGALLAQCGQALLERGHQIAGIATTASGVLAWARQAGLAVAPSVPELAPGGFDYLFSVANMRMLPAEVLRLPRELAINFHDGLLPPDAGVHATAWAILRDAKQHGVTWHVMQERADTGDILLQRQVPVLPDDTSWTLNGRCFEAGLESFRELVAQLESGRVKRVKQDLSRRSYHGKWDRPDGGLTISWQRTAEEISALVRAADFGSHANPFGTVKVRIAGELLPVTRVSVSGRWSIDPPGTVLACSQGSVTVATASHELILHDLPARCVPGTVLSEPAADERAELTGLYRTALQQETIWVDRLTELHPLALPHLSHSVTPQQLVMPVKPGLSREQVTSATLAFLARITQQETVGVRVPGDGKGLLATVVPLSIPPLTEFAAHTETVTGLLRQITSHANDIWLRYPQLPAEGVSYPVVVDLTGEPMPGGLSDQTVIQIGEDGGCTWHLPGHAMSTSDATALVGAFGLFLDGLHDSPLDRVPIAPRQAPLAPRDYPADRRVHELIAEQARRTPGEMALRYRGATFTYADLSRRVDVLAAQLAARGIGAGDLVGVHLRRSPDLVVALLAVLTTGAAYVPLDPVYPRDRIASMLADAQVKLLLSDTFVSYSDTPVLMLPLASLLPTATRQKAVDPADTPAYVIYTSGSTGRPKGVQIGHRALTNFLFSMAKTPGLSPGDRLLAVTTICFDIAALELFLPLMTGATVEIADASTARDGHALLAQLERSRATVIQATPVTWKMLIAAGWQSSPRLRVWCGGEALNPDLAADLLTRSAQVWNLYGPTETTIWSTVSRVLPGEAITLGDPVANTSLHLLDPNHQPVPAGVPGELYIGGDGLADGYLGQPELTAERFIDVPGEGRLYRTGDLACVSDGQLRFLGRNDHQVKIRGFRIELGEIEATLARQNGVSQAVVIAHQPGPAEPQLAAYVVPAAGISPDIPAWRAALAEVLPDYMVPATFTPLDRFPTTSNGKLDRKALPAPRAVILSRQPANATEERLCALFSQNLGGVHIGPDDDYFALGGDSLRAISLANGFTVADLFRYPTPAALAAHLDGGTAASQETDLLAEVLLDPAIRPRTRRQPDGSLRRVLLTGATGFLGAFLLSALARDGNTRITCLIRGEAHRVWDTLTAYRLSEPASGAEIEILRGDLTQPLLGLGQAGFNELAASVDLIFHAGAAVHFLHSYEQLKAANVGGTQEILRLAALNSTPVHYLSSMGVFGHSARCSARRAPEDVTGPVSGLGNGYQKSKWVAESMIGLARDRGLPVTIHRAARITGDSQSGACQTNDYLWRILKGCVQAGGVPQGVELTFDLVPADQAAKAIAWIASQPELTGGTFHHANPVLTSFAEVVELLRDHGYVLADLDKDKWADLIAADPGNAAHALLGTFMTTAWSPLHETLLDPTSTERILDPALRCPPPGRDLFGVYLRYFQETGYLPPVSVC
jgi:amino acid adenylation domain-containing protein/thioester reductase-like protein